MNIGYYIAKTLLKSKSTISTAKAITTIAQIGIAAGVCVMLLSIFITAGFKKQITDGISGITPAITLQKASDSRGIYKGSHIDNLTIEKLKEDHRVANIYPLINNSAILKQSDILHGVIIQGIDSTATLTFLQEHLIEGRLPNLLSCEASSEIVISQTISQLMKLKVGDKLQCFFVAENSRVRPMNVCGIISTNIKEIDEALVICDLRTLQKINGWNADEYQSYAIELHNIADSEPFAYEIDRITENAISGNGWYIKTIFDTHPEIFDWLQLLDMNVWVILILLALVAGFNMISSILILILERTTFVGIMKATGLENSRLREIFLWISAALTGKGMLWGNIAALAITIAQYYFHIIKLDPEIYYMAFVPVSFSIEGLIAINISVLALTTIMMVVPTMIISKINPIKVIRFE